MTKTNKKSKADKVVSFLEKKFTSKVKLALASGVLLALAASSFYSFKDEAKKSQTVMVRNLSESSGGSGVIYQSDTGKSTILTNNHICNVVKDGGYVSTSNGERYFVSSFVRSAVHDVCMITINYNLGVNTKIASSAPEVLEEAVISGHPALLPTVLSRGHFSKRQTIHLLKSFRNCSNKEFTDPSLGLICMFLGGKLPVFTAFESVVVTATIMGGSSGSAVYDSNGEIGGLVFAGSGKRQLSYAYIVPYEYVYRFVTEEVKFNPVEYPDYTVEIATIMRVYTEEERRQVDINNQLQEHITVCNKATPKEWVYVRNICDILISNSELQ